ncbi:ATP-binding cassette domain-containing protein [Streptomyces sp. NPDC050147]|uniref:ATP-binding cassette domain-containing protein n=1 Tax=Streptomyces sp. NPDC050147 TaxID=3155513 RepID=UPI00344145F7
MRRVERAQPPSTSQGPYRRGVRFLWRRWPVVLRLALWSVLETGQTFLTGYALARALDDGFLAGREAVGLGWLGGAGLGVVVAAYGTGRVYRAVADLVEPLRDTLVRQVVGRGLREADGASVSRLTQQVEIARDTFAGLVLVSRSFLFTAAGALIGLFSLAPLLLLVVAPPLLAGVGLFVASLRPLALRQERFLVADEGIAGQLGSVAPGLRDVAAAGAEQDVAEDLDRGIATEYAAAGSLARWGVLRTAALVTGGQLPLVLLLVTAPWLLNSGVTPGALVGAIAYVSQALLPALHNLIHGLGTSGSRLAVVLRRLTWTPPPEPPDPPETKTPAAETPTPGGIRTTAGAPARGDEAAPAGMPAPDGAPARGDEAAPAGMPAPDGAPARDDEPAPDRRETPAPGRTGTPAPDEKPAAGGVPAPARTVSPAPGRTPASGGVPAPGGRPAPGRTGTPAPYEEPAAGGVPAPGRAPVSGGRNAPGRTHMPAPGEKPAPGRAPVSGGRNAPGRTGTPALDEEPAPGGIPAPTGALAPSGTPTPTGAPTPHEKTTPDEPPALQLSSVTFAYGPRAEPVVRDLSLAVPRGGHLAVVGPSGIGKSTLAGLVAGLLAPGSGAVRVDGRSVRGREAVERRVLIPQEAYVFSGTVRQNLEYLRADAVDDAELLAAARAVGLSAVIDRLGGLAAPVDPAALSAGERQLIALTRAYVSYAPLALLDEATCHLDPVAEARAERAFAARPGGTLVVIAHRISSARRADRILVMDGTHTFCGRHEELLERSSLYRELSGNWGPGDGSTSHPALPLRDPYGVDPVAGAGLAGDRGHVVAHRPVRQMEAVRDLGDGRAPGSQ